MEKLIFSLPYPPTENHMYRNVYRYTATGKRYTARMYTEKAQAWIDGAVESVNKIVADASWTALDRKTVVEIIVYFPDKRNRDAPNLPKILLDALEKGGVYVNDRWALSRIMDFHVASKKEEARVELIIYAL